MGLREFLRHPSSGETPTFPHDYPFVSGCFAQALAQLLRGLRMNKEYLDGGLPGFRGPCFGIPIKRAIVFRGVGPISGNAQFTAGKGMLAW